MSNFHSPALFANMMKSQGYGEIPGAPQAGMMPGKLHGHVSFNQNDNVTFSQTVANMISSANQTLGAPEQLTIEAVTTGNVDIHEVMIAMGKSEVAFKLITAVAQKGIGTFDKLTNMQI